MRLLNKKKCKGLLFENPNHMHQLLNVLAETVIDYLNNQIEAGADSVMIFDTWGGILKTPNYMNFSLYYMKIIC